LCRYVWPLPHAAGVGAGSPAAREEAW
jgi:hypothetical protein